MFEMKLFLNLDQMLLNPTPKWFTREVMRLQENKMFYELCLASENFYSKEMDSPRFRWQIYPLVSLQDLIIHLPIPKAGFPFITTQSSWVRMVSDHDFKISFLKGAIN